MTIQKVMYRAGIAAAAVLLLMPVAGHAQERLNPLTVSYENLSAARDSVRARAEATEVRGDDTLRYELRFTNHENRGLTDIVFTNPVPSGVTLIAGTVQADVNVSIDYSIDGGVTFHARPIMSVLENGRTIQREAPASVFTHIRWTIGDVLAPGAVVAARYDVRVAGR